MPELLLQEAPSQTETLAPTVKIMDRLHAEEIFGTPEQSKAFLDSLSFEDFKKWTDMVNGLEREIPKSERGGGTSQRIQSENPLAGSEVVYRPPVMQFREELLEAALRKAQSIEDPATAGLTLGFAINAIHPYPDGNGRTGRMMFALLSKGYDGSPEAKDFYTRLLENTKGQEVINPNPAEHGVDKVIAGDIRRELAAKKGYAANDEPRRVIGGYGDAMAGEENARVIQVAAGISEKDKARLDWVLQDGPFTVSTLLASFSKEKLDGFTTQNSTGANMLNVDRLAAQLTEAQINGLFGNAARVKKDYAERLISFSDRKDADEIVQAYSVQ